MRKLTLNQIAEMVNSGESLDGIEPENAGEKFVLNTLRRQQKYMDDMGLIRAGKSYQSLGYFIPPNKKILVKRRWPKIAAKTAINAR